MENTYNKTTWINGQTPVNATNLNNIEEGINYLYQHSLDVNEITGGNGINISGNGSSIEISTPALLLHEVVSIPASQTDSGNVGDFCIDGDYLYFCIKQNYWIRILIDAWIDNEDK